MPFPKHIFQIHRHERIERIQNPECIFNVIIIIHSASVNFQPETEIGIQPVRKIGFILGEHRTYSVPGGIAVSCILLANDFHSAVIFKNIIHIHKYGLIERIRDFADIIKIPERRKMPVLIFGRQPYP